jgi:hypothetical protein
MNWRVVALRKTLPLMLFLFGSLRVEAGTIRVLVLNGKDGKPAQGRTVEILPPGTTSKPLFKGTTDQHGIFEIDAAKLPNRIAVLVKDRLLCKGTFRGTSVQSLDEIISLGVVESNDCNAQVNPPREPGLLILFVRREKMPEIFD